jgi:ABC-2 type transport system permease protein
LKNAWTLTKIRMRLALRNRAFIFFSLVFPMAILFLYLAVFGRGKVAAVPYLLASVLALTIMGSFWGLSVQLVTFREQGILRRFRLAPVSAGAMLGSSILSNYLMTLPTIILEFAIARGIFDLTSWGNIAGILLLVTLGTVTFAALGLIVASVTNTMQETQVINQILWWGFLGLSGATLPLPLLPGWLQTLAAFQPATYLVTGLERVMVGHVSVLAIAPELLSLALSAAIAFVISQQLFRWEPGARVPRSAKLWAASAVIPFLLLGVWESTHGQLRAGAHQDYLSIEQPAPTDLSR